MDGVKNQSASRSRSVLVNGFTFLCLTFGLAAGNLFEWEKAEAILLAVGNFLIFAGILWLSLEDNQSDPDLLKRYRSAIIVAMLLLLGAGGCFVFQIASAIVAGLVSAAFLVILGANYWYWLVDYEWIASASRE